MTKAPRIRKGRGAFSVLLRDHCARAVPPSRLARICASVWERPRTTFFPSADVHCHFAAALLPPQDPQAIALSLSVEAGRERGLLGCAHGPVGRPLLHD